MKRRPLPLPAAAAAAVVAALCAIVPALGHDFFLVPAPSTVSPGRAVDVAMHISGVFPGEPGAWRDPKEFFMFDARGRVDLLDAPKRGVPARARVDLRTPGTTIIALRTNPSYIELPPKAFEAYLKDEGHDDILEMRRRMKSRDDRGRERYTRFVKTIVGAPDTVALAGLGMTLEIVPMAVPGGLRPGDRLPVKVQFEGQPYAGGRLCATYADHSGKDGDYAWCGPLDGGGRAEVPIEKAGWQLLRVTKMRSLAGDERADWVSYWASLTFEVFAPARSGAAREASRNGDR